MPHIDTEHDSTAAVDVRKIRINDQPVPRRNGHQLFDVGTSVINGIESHSRKIDVGIDSETTNWNKFASLHCFLERETMCRVFKDLQQVFTIRSFGRRSKPQNKLRPKIRKNSAPCVGCRMMRFIQGAAFYGSGRKLRE